EFDSAPTAFALVATSSLYERSVGDDTYRGFAAHQRGWVLGANAWGSSFMIGVGTTYPRCPEHQVANLADAGELLGAVVNGPNAAEILEEPNAFEAMVPCDEGAADGRPFSDFDGQGAAYVDTVGSWQTSEPAIDFTATAVLALALSGTGGR
ncbi:MAG TPA: glycoside hydrolase family 9 protein, partial [Iamia sp.]|nr:glycoside hydrolase family 9 protein [Iamia sp.]